MHIRESQNMIRVPGNPNATAHVSREWVCRECDYFEEVEEES